MFTLRKYTYRYFQIAVEIWFILAENCKKYPYKFHPRLTGLRNYDEINLKYLKRR